MRRFALVGVIAGLALGTAGQASAAVLYEQFPAAGEFESPSVRSHAESVAADDFHIADGYVWRIQAVEVLGQALSSGSHTASVSLFADAGGRPGTLLFSQAGISIADCPTRSSAECNFTATVNGAPALSPGVYWLSVSTAGESVWAWQVHTPDTAYGAPALWQSSASASTCTSWAPLMDCSLTTAQHGKDLTFALSGSLTNSNFSIVNFDAKGLRLFADLNVPAAGTMALAGKGVKRSTKQLAAGAHRVRVKLRANVVERLRSGRKARLLVRLTFTAQGGDPVTQIQPVKLVPTGRPAG